MRSILVVDDSRTARLFMVSRLSQLANTQVVAVESGEEALATMDGCQFDLVVTDLVMPGIDGIQLIRLFRQTHPDVPVILITGRGSESIAARSLRAGAVNYIPKRELADALVPVCEEILDVREADRLLDEIDEFEVSRRSEFQIPPDLAIGRRLADRLAILASTRGRWSGTWQTQAAVAFRELLDNAIIHGCLEIPKEHAHRQISRERLELAAQARKSMQPFGRRSVRVALETNERFVRAVITDDGNGFDTTRLRDQNSAPESTGPESRGLFLARKLLDQVEHNAAGNQVTVTKLRDNRIEAATRAERPTPSAMAWSSTLAVN